MSTFVPAIRIGKDIVLFKDTLVVLETENSAVVVLRVRKYICDHKYKYAPE